MTKFQVSTLSGTDFKLVGAMVSTTLPPSNSLSRIGLKETFFILVGDKEGN